MFCNFAPVKSKEHGFKKQHMVVAKRTFNQKEVGQILMFV